jgi:uncharacterized protein YdeI (YjbR/CyaY-like superfamily)
MSGPGEPLDFTGRKEWRAWLQTNHGVQKEAWVKISKKRASTVGVTLEEATEEALCFGWIDSFMKPIDGDSYALRYSPRRPGSNWSDTNKKRAIMLIDEGRMTEAGLAAIEAAKRSGKWREEDSIPTIQLRSKVSCAALRPAVCSTGQRALDRRGRWSRDGLRRRARSG